MLVLKKHSFFLLEVILALVLFTLLALPWMSNTLFLLRQDHKQIEEVEYERIAALSFVEIYEKFLTQEIPWGDFSKEAGKKSFSLSETSFRLPGQTPFPLKRSFSLILLKEKKDLENNFYRRVEVSLSLSKRQEEKIFSKVFYLERQA